MTMKLVYSRFIVMILILLYAVPTCASETSGVITTKRDYSAEIIQCIESMPSWVNYPSSSSINWDLRDLMISFSKFSTENIRNSLARYLQTHSYKPENMVDLWGKLYVLNRILFAVPTEETAATYQRFGGWLKHRFESNEQITSSLWPLRNESGRLVLSYNFSGYFGGPYNALAEFDYLNKIYGRRS